MQTYQASVFPLKEIQANASNEPAETLVAVRSSVPVARASGEKQSEERFVEAEVASPPRHRQLVLPPWPTSQPGPEITALSQGQRVVLTRTDQVTYDFYDQERGLPGLPHKE